MRSSQQASPSGPTPTTGSGSISAAETITSAPWPPGTTGRSKSPAREAELALLARRAPQRPADRQQHECAERNQREVEAGERERTPARGRCPEHLLTPRHRVLRLAAHASVPADQRRRAASKRNADDSQRGERRRNPDHYFSHDASPYLEYTIHISPLNCE